MPRSAEAVPLDEEPGGESQVGDAGAGESPLAKPPESERSEPAGEPTRAQCLRPGSPEPRDLLQRQKGSEQAHGSARGWAHVADEVYAVFARVLAGRAFERRALLADSSSARLPTAKAAPVIEVPR